MLYQHLPADTQGFIWVVTHQIPPKTDRSSSNYICPTQKFCATFWKPTSNINHWISTLLPVVWTSTLIFMMPQISLYSDQVRNRGALSGMQMTPGSCSNRLGEKTEHLSMTVWITCAKIIIIRQIIGDKVTFETHRLANIRSFLVCNLQITTDFF